MAGLKKTFTIKESPPDVQEFIQLSLGGITLLQNIKFVLEAEKKADKNISCHHMNLSRIYGICRNSNATDFWNKESDIKCLFVFDVFMPTV